LNNIIGAGAVDDYAWAPVDHSVPNSSRLIVSGVAPRNHFAPDRLPENRYFTNLQRGIDIALR
jgi:hypothetical protein